jgi:hypothetical protein
MGLFGKGATHMPKQLILQIEIPLPDDIFEQSAVMAKIKAPWDALLAACKNGDRTIGQSMRVDDIKAPRASRRDAGSKRAPRTNGTTAPAPDVIPAPGETAFPL